MKVYGLLGKDLSHSFSKKYFSEKFSKQGINAVYENFPLQGISLFPQFIESNQAIDGFNVTIPYKKSIIYFLDEIEKEAEEINAVNTVKVLKKNGDLYLKGFNTDIYGFEKSLTPLLNQNIKNALILGTGGASSAVAHVLRKLGISYTFVSRSPSNKTIRYEDLTQEIIRSNELIVNTTPLGTVGEYYNQLLFPTRLLTKNHLCYDLVYNPEITRFLSEAENRGAQIKNGYEMLILQAEKAWEIWND